MGLEALLRGWVSRQQPQATTDQNPAVVRLGRYGEVYGIQMVRKQHALADEGSYFATNNAQSGLIIGSGTSFSATAPALIVFNTDSASNANAKRIHIDYVRMDLSSIGSVTSPAIALAVVVDTGSRYSSGGTNLTANIVNPNIDVSARASVANVYFGALTATTATSAARTVVGQRYLRAVTSYVVGDGIQLNVGAVEGLTGQNFGTVGTSPLVVFQNLPPIVIGPQESALFYLWEPGATVTTAPSFLPEVGWWER